VSTARWNPKEAAGKMLVRRTGSTYEAAMLYEKAYRFKSNSCMENMAVDALMTKKLQDNMAEMPEPGVRGSGQNPRESYSVR
jgi:hypothetical protein